MNDGNLVFVTSQVVEEIAHQNSSEHESHQVELSVSENKSELCDLTKCEVESIHIESMRDTPHKKRDSNYQSCEDVFQTNTLISTFSIISPNL